jgi:hypothetical protein
MTSLVPNLTRDPDWWMTDRLRSRAGGRPSPDRSSSGSSGKASASAAFTTRQHDIMIVNYYTDVLELKLIAFLQASRLGHSQDYLICLQWISFKIPIHCHKTC